MMPISGLAPWFGAKRTLAPRIVAELGTHRMYWEPFCGSMAVLLRKPPVVMETVNDLHGELVNLARCLQCRTRGPRLYRRLRRTLLSEDLYREQQRLSLAASPTEEADEDLAYAYFVCAWQGRNGVAGTRESKLGFCARYTANGGHAAKRWHSAVESIPQWRRRISNVTILRRDAFELLDRIDDADSTALYVDPPYIEKGATYVHDLLTEDHRRLAEALHRFRRARVVLSYYDHAVVRELYRGWTFVDCMMSKSLANEGLRDRSGVTRAPEVLIINGPSYTDGGLWA